jgi:hypothetical protein
MVEIERTAVGLQMVIPGCERRTLPKSSSSANWFGQGLLGFYIEPTLRETFARRADAPLKPKRGQKPLPRSGLFGT